MPKKVEKKEAVPETKPEPEPEFKLPKKKASRAIPAKEEPKEEEAPFGKIKLKKSERVQRTWDDGGLEQVDLKHHEFENTPQDVQPENRSTIKLGKVLDCDIEEKEEKSKKKKKKSKKEDQVEEEKVEQEDDDDQEETLEEEVMLHPYVTPSNTIITTDF